MIADSFEEEDDNAIIVCWCPSSWSLFHLIVLLRFYQIEHSLMCKDADRCIPHAEVVSRSFSSHLLISICSVPATLGLMVFVRFSVARHHFPPVKRM